MIWLTINVHIQGWIDAFSQGGILNKAKAHFIHNTVFIHKVKLFSPQTETQADNVFISVIN